MYDSFLYSVGVVLPILIVAVLGFLLKRTGLVSGQFFEYGNEFVFKVALPASLFLTTVEIYIKNVILTDFLGYSVLASVAVILILWLTVPLFVRDNAKRGAFIQGAYRSSLSVMGIPLADGMFGQAGTALVALLLPIMTFIYNIFAVLILGMYSPHDKKANAGRSIAAALPDIVKNPLIISVAAAIPFTLLGVKLPAFVADTVSYIAKPAFPLAILMLGANLGGGNLKGRLPLVVSAAFIKIIAIPAAAVSVAALIGFRGAELGVIFTLFASPTTVTSYIMAKDMHSDYDLTADITVIANTVSMLTLFIGIFTLKTLGLI